MMTSGEYVLLERSTVRLGTLRADTVFERMGGLLRLPELNQGEALLLNDCKSIHTVGMKYPLDLVYLNQHNKVIKTVCAIKPNRASFCFRASSVLELVAGEINRLDIKLGMMGHFYE